MIELYTIKGFDDFCSERESIRLQKDRDEPYPWTDDEILRTKKFCNIDRKDDRLTRDFISMISKKDSDGYKLMATLFFRMTSGNIVPDYLNGFNSVGELVRDNCSLTKFNKGKQNPYQFPMYIKGMTVRTYIRDYLLKNSHGIIKEFMTFKKVSFLDAMARLNKAIAAPKMMKFIIFQACADLSLLFPDKIDGDSMPYWGLGSTTALREIRNVEGIERKTIIAGIRELHPDWTLLKIEHALCEYHKYCQYKMNKKKGCLYNYTSCHQNSSPSSLS